MHTIKIICGPTASGKSARALALAEKTGGVIINADAMQVYRELPILTAQPSMEDKACAEHRLYGVIGAEESCSAGLWAEWAEREIRACWAAEKLPIVTGGTGLYIKALMEGFSEMPEVSEEWRLKGAALWKELGAEKFHAMLMEKDPETAARLKVNDKQRHIRAWEIFLATGKPLGWWQSQPRVSAFPEECFEIEFVNPPRAELYRRCDERFVKMLSAGVLAEVKALLPKGEGGAERRMRGNDNDPSPDPSDHPLPLGEGFAVTNALGFKELSAHLSGKMMLEEAITQAQQATRNYAKRQITWFRNQI